MCLLLLGNASFGSILLRIDEELAEKVKKGQCQFCGDLLDRANYPRSARGVSDSDANQFFDARFSFCCRRDGCRRRSTPPSVRFLGAKVYVFAAVALVTALRQGPTPRSLRVLGDVCGADRRTLVRWQRWWRETVVESRFWRAKRASFLPPIDSDKVPLEVLNRMGVKDDDAAGVARMLTLFSPLSCALSFKDLEGR